MLENRPQIAANLGRLALASRLQGRKAHILSAVSLSCCLKFGIQTSIKLPGPSFHFFADSSGEKGHRILAEAPALGENEERFS